jgi:hypothetical protein
MYKFKVQGATFTLDDEHLEKSNYLKTLMTTLLPVKKDDNGAFVLDESDVEAFSCIVYFLKTGTIDDRMYAMYQDKFHYYIDTIDVYPKEFEKIRDEELMCRNTIIDPKSKSYKTVPLIELPDDIQSILATKEEIKSIGINECNTIIGGSNMVAKVKQPNFSIDTFWFEATKRSYIDKNIRSKLIDVLCKLDMTNVAIAGGSIICYLTGDRIEDVDMFFTAIDASLYSMNHANKTILGNINYLREELYSLGLGLIIRRTSNAITLIIAENHNDHKPNVILELQYILRIYNNVNEVLMGFDIDSCCFAYHDGKLITTKRGMFSLKYNVNCVDFTRLSPTYERRLVKYFERGFNIYIPLIDKDDVKLFDLKKNKKQSSVNSGCKRGLSFIMGRTNLHSGRLLDEVRPNEALFQRECDYVVGSKCYVVPNGLNHFSIKDGLNNKVNIYAIMGKYYRPTNDGLYALMSNEFISQIESILTTSNTNYSFGAMDKSKGYTSDCKRFCDLHELYIIVDSYMEIHDLSIPEPITPLFSIPEKIQYTIKNPGKQLTSAFHKIILQEPHVWYDCISLPEWKKDLLKMKFTHDA